ncbi:GtrA family protein [Syntrophobotulus glycolicus DSM 8271]|uniref:GtrA family protein n=1 Tax=Syntrophobotulus glycolicus (strain DSM 8271 / FlGlyR) TaxID=645991 RepID=F0SYB0_SYNGF|nr:GtrA family protein [Syntrophobotulus glycolicus]ADY55945.1 GtrA family protein [Syntrophobotulus glycolicus DSM 8271]
MPAKIQHYAKFLKYCLVGGVNTAVDLILFFLLSLIGAPLLIAQCVGYSGGFFNSFILNRKWTFQTYGPSGRQFIRFIGLNLFTLALTYGAIVGLHDQLQWPLMISKIISTVLCTGINYTGSRLWVFSDPAASI